MTNGLLAGASAFLFAGVASIAGAQCAPGGPRTPVAAYKTLSGIVLDEENHPLENATILIRKPYRETTTTVDGRFMISLDTGTYDVIVRKIGYEVFAWPYEVGLKGGVARICLAREVHVLPPSISAVSGLGLSGIIADSLMKAMPGAEVRAIGAGEHAITDSAGAFYMGLRPGTYAIVVTKAGYGRQLLSVTIPKDSGRQITAFLGPAPCPAIINGGPYSLPLSIIDKRDVAMVEAYAISPPRRRGAAPRFSMSPCPVKVYVWMKP